MSDEYKLAKEIELLHTESVVPYERNNKVHDDQAVERLANSIREFGFTQPILIDESNVLLAGHKRLAAAKSLGIEQVPVVRKIDLTEDQKKAYRIIDNKTTDDSEWNFENLEIELAELKEADFEIDRFILNNFEFDAKSLDEPEDDDFEQTAEQESRCDVKPGDLIELGRHRVLCGDSTKLESFEHLFDGAVAQMIFTDPPYGVDYDGGAKKREKLANDNLGTQIYGLALPLLAKFTDQKAPIYLWYADGHAAAAAAAAAAAGFQIVAQIIWAKNHAQFVTSAHYKGKHEPCYYGHKKGKAARWFGPNNEVTLWEYDRSPKNEFHPTQKPIELATRAISNSTELSDIILDAFLGSGSTLIAADSLSRRCFGLEMQPKYCQVIIDRYHAYCESHKKDFECKINGEPYFG